MSWNSTPKNAKEAMEMFKAGVADLEEMVKGKIFSAEEGEAKKMALKTVLDRELEALKSGSQFERPAPHPATQSAGATQGVGASEATGAEKAIQELYAEYVGPKNALALYKEAHSYLRNVASCPNTLVREAITEHIHRYPVNELLQQLFSETGAGAVPECLRCAGDFAAEPLAKRILIESAARFLRMVVAIIVAGTATEDAESGTGDDSEEEEKNFQRQVDHFFDLFDAKKAKVRQAMSTMVKIKSASESLKKLGKVTKKDPKEESPGNRRERRAGQFGNRGNGRFGNRFGNRGGGNDRSNNDRNNNRGTGGYKRAGRGVAQKRDRSRSPRRDPSRQRDR